MVQQKLFQMVYHAEISLLSQTFGRPHLNEVGKQNYGSVS